MSESLPSTTGSSSSQPPVLPSMRRMPARAWLSLRRRLASSARRSVQLSTQSSHLLSSVTAAGRSRATPSLSGTPQRRNSKMRHSTNWLPSTVTFTSACVPPPLCT